MSETKAKQQVVIDELVGLGFVEQEAAKMVTVVFNAQALARQKQLQAYNGKRVVFEAGGLHIEGWVHDVKVVQGKTSFHVKPIAGEGTIWVDKIIRVLN